MLLSAFAVFICLFLLSIAVLVMLHRHIEARSLKQAIDGPALPEANSGHVIPIRRESATPVSPRG